MLERAFLHAVVFLCGGAVLVIELISARHMGPFYGHSLAVWTSVIGVTLAALSVGYAVGGALADRLVAKAKAMSGLAAILAVSAVGCALLPVWGPAVMRAAEPAGLIGGTLLSCVVLLTPPLGALGMIGPYVIRVFTTQVEHAGRVAGRMFAISTVGSILAAMGTGFWLAPTLGVRWTCFSVGALLLILASIAMFMRGRPVFAMGGTLALAVLLAPAAMQANRRPPYTFGEYTIVDIRESLQGQVKVIERGDDRIMLLDGIFQTGVDTSTNVSHFAYVHVICGGLSVLEQGSDVTVVGIGGGMIPRMLSEMGFDVTAVDYNPVMAPVAREWFGLPDAVADVVADGRRHIEQLEPASVDAIVLDAFTGEREPVHLLTREALEACRRAMRPDGFLVLNVLMYVTGERGRAFAGVMETLRAAEWEATAVATGTNEEARNILIFARPFGSPEWELHAGGALGRLDQERALAVRRSLTSALDLAVEPEALDGVIAFTDDRSNLDVLNRAYNEAWRRGQLQNMPKEILLY